MKIKQSNTDIVLFHEYSTIGKLEDFLLSSFFGRVETKEPWTIECLVTPEEFHKFNEDLSKEIEKFSLTVNKRTTEDMLFEKPNDTSFKTSNNGTLKFIVTDETKLGEIQTDN